MYYIQKWFSPTQLTNASLFSARSFIRMQYWLPSICVTEPHPCLRTVILQGSSCTAEHSVCESSQPCVTHTLPWVTHLLCETWHDIFGGCGSREIVCVCIHESLQVLAFVIHSVGLSCVYVCTYRDRGSLWSELAGWSVRVCVMEREIVLDRY